MAETAVVDVMAMVLPARLMNAAALAHATVIVLVIDLMLVTELTHETVTVWLLTVDPLVLSGSQRISIPMLDCLFANDVARPHIIAREIRNVRAQLELARAAA